MRDCTHAWASLLPSIASASRVGQARTREVSLHHGFFEMPLGTKSVLGYPNLSHGGHTGQCVSRLMLFPQWSLGIFVATNSPSGGNLTSSLCEDVGARIAFSTSLASTAMRRADGFVIELGGPRHMWGERSASSAHGITAS